MKSLFFLFILFLGFNGIAQDNLVPNPSFEVLDSCPYFGDQIHFAAPWYAPDGSPDLYNTCATIWNWQVPENQFGYQEARTGDGYVGGVIYPIGENFEYIGVQLESPLVEGKTYLVSFYASLSNEIYLGSNNIGAHFSEEAVIGDIQFMDITPQVNGEVVISDLEAWTLIEGEFTAEGGEEYLSIGNFFTLAMTDTAHLPTTVVDISYYYIDDVSVTLVEDDDDEQSSIESIILDQGIAIYPNPFTNYTTVSFEQPLTENHVVVIHNAIGQEVYRNENVIGSSLKIEKGQMETGVYVLSVFDSDLQEVFNTKLLVE